MRIWFLCSLALASFSCCAERDSTAVKKASHYIGIQANQLLSQLFNLTNSSSIVVNPYLINYSVNSIRSGWGLNTGVGYTVDNSDQSDANTSSKTQSNNFSFRIGGERKVSIAKKWMISYGFDLLYDKKSSTTTSTSEFQLNISETDTDISSKDSGFGPRFTLNYFITPKIILGTESTYYYKAITTTQNVTNTNTTVTVDPITGQQTSSTNTSNTNTTATVKQFHFAVPAIIFVILKF